MQNNFDDLWDYQNPQQTREKFVKLLPLPDKNENAQLKTQIARTYSLQRKFVHAHNLLDEVQDDLEKFGHELQPLTSIRYFLERGRTYNSEKNYSDASLHFDKAWRLSCENNYDFYGIDALHMLAIASPPDSKDAMYFNLEALKIAENTTDERAKNWCGSLYNNIGWAYFENEEYAKAHEIFCKTEEWYKNKNDENYTRVAQWSIAKVLRMQNKISEALKIQQQLEKIYREKQQPDGYVYEEIAECYLKQQNPQYKEYAQKAYDELSKDIWLQNNEATRLQRLLELATL